jgi:putative nucleotidyltransferase with HDIG domain
MRQTTETDVASRLKLPTTFRIHHALVVLAAIAALILTAPQAGRVDPATLAILLALMAIAEATAIRLPHGGYVSIGGVLDMAGLVLVGPVYTAWANAIATLVVQGPVLRRPWTKVTHNAAAFVLTALGAGSVFEVAGGMPGRLTFPGDLVPLVACGAAYFVLNSLFVSLAIGLSSRGDPWQVWQKTFLRGLVHHVSFVSLGALIAFVYLHAGPWGLPLIAIPFVVSYLSFKIYVEIRRDLKDFVRALADVLDEVDPYTRQHSFRVSRYAIRLARAMRLPESEVEDLEYAALVHDLGKIGPQHQHILQKPGGLTQEEQSTLQSHPAAGAHIVRKVKALRRSSEIVKHHHERPDGQGYPLGLRTPEIPRGARILNVADAFDAMTSDRPYRQALSLDAAIAELEKGSGHQFDAEVVQCLLELHHAGAFPAVPSPTREELRALRVGGRRAS